VLEILQFIFSSFWIWLGTVILLVVIFEGFTDLFKGIFRRFRDNKNDKE
jgi:hypothetical protein